MKRVYEKPMAFEEAFVSNEYVAACYYLACLVGSKGTFSKNDKANYLWKSDEKGYGIWHSANQKGTCSDKHANRVITDHGGIFEKVQENNSASGGQGWINGGFDDWIDVKNDGKMNAGDIIYWHTNNSDNKRQWNHYGVLEAADSNHPNHS